MFVFLYCLINILLFIILFRIQESDGKTAFTHAVVVIFLNLIILIGGFLFKWILSKTVKLSFLAYTTVTLIFLFLANELVYGCFYKSPVMFGILEPAKKIVQDVNRTYFHQNFIKGVMEIISWSSLISVLLVWIVAFIQERTNNFQSDSANPI